MSQSAGLAVQQMQDIAERYFMPGLRKELGLAVHQPSQPPIINTATHHVQTLLGVQQMSGEKADESLLRVFNSFDEYQTGMLGVGDLQRALVRLGLDPTSRTLKVAVESVRQCGFGQQIESKLENMCGGV